MRIAEVRIRRNANYPDINRSLNSSARIEQTNLLLENFAKFLASILLTIGFSYIVIALKFEIFLMILS